MDVMRYATEHGCKLFDFTIGDEPTSASGATSRSAFATMSPRRRPRLAGGGPVGCGAWHQAPHQAQPGGLGRRP
jgi:hypothetical protein